MLVQYDMFSMSYQVNGTSGTLVSQGPGEDTQVRGGLADCLLKVEMFLNVLHRRDDTL